jgi:hypothetical protein
MVNIFLLKQVLQQYVEGVKSDIKIQYVMSIIIVIVFVFFPHIDRPLLLLVSYRTRTTP